MAKLRIDEADLLGAIEGDEFGAYVLDRQTGEVIRLSEYDEIEEEEEIRELIDADTSGRFLEVERMQSHDAFRIMSGFVDSLPEGRAAEELDDALGRNRPFRRFKDTLHGYPELREQWFAYHEARMREEALAWLELHEIDAELVNKYAAED
ncbi:MAG TPA: UPF0158 family protein [Longimicrobiaceae bacterium]|nr:UPF0158 family protein [Longimicrobiaceae bacterium]